MRTTETGGGAPDFGDCRDPECDACRATRYYGVAWSADKCINAGRRFNLQDHGRTITAALQKWRPSDDESIEGQLAPLEIADARCSCGWEGPGAAADDHMCPLEREHDDRFDAFLDGHGEP